LGVKQAVPIQFGPRAGPATSKIDVTLKLQFIMIAAFATEAAAARIPTANILRMTRISTLLKEGFRDHL
jgi:hypothetical protein